MKAHTPNGIGSQKPISRNSRIAGNTVLAGSPNRTNAPIKPASTVPTPAAGEGARLATIPTKYP